MTPCQLANEWLCSHLKEVLNHLQLNVKKVGTNYVTGNLSGEKGQSLSIAAEGPKAGLWKDFANGEKGNISTLWRKVRGIEHQDYATFFSQLEAFSGQNFGYIPPGAIPDWNKCRAGWDNEYAERLVALRGYSRQFVDWLYFKEMVGVYRSCIAFPIWRPDGTLSGIHYYDETKAKKKLRFSKGTNVYPLVFGDTSGPITDLYVHEGEWDAYAQADRSGLYLQKGVRFLATRGAWNAEKIKDQVPKDCRIFLWTQNDQPDKDGRISNDEWVANIGKNTGTADIYIVKIPLEYKDVNDWTRAGASKEDLQKALQEANPYTKDVSDPPQSPKSKHCFETKKRPYYTVHKEPFIGKNGILSPNGVYLHGLEKRKIDGETTLSAVDIWICSYLRAIAVISFHGKEHSYLLEYIPHGKTEPKRLALPQASLLGRPDCALKILRDAGVSILNRHSNEVVDYLDSEHFHFNSQTQDKFWQAVKTTGWESSNRFILPDQIIGNPEGVWFDSNFNVAKYDQKGSLCEWQSHVAVPAIGNPYLIFALACAFSGPLLKGLEIPGIGFHLTGDSSTGKTTALCVASSVWGSGSETDGFFIRWQTTINRLEIEAACRCDVLLPIDESHQAPTAAVLDSAPYMLVNGQGKTRLNRDSSAKETLHWRVCVLSTGESPLEQHLADAKIEHKVGQNVRICDIPLKAKYGIFDSLGCFTDPNAFSDSLRLAASSFYGTPGPVFVQKLIETRPNLKIELDQCFAGLKSKLHSLSAQQTRVLRSFALVALAGELATSFGILPFSQGDSLKAVSRIFATWKTMQPDSIASKESAQILAKITDFIDTHATSRFSHLAGGTRGFISNNGEIHQEADSKVINRAGYTFKENGSRLFGFTSSGLREAAKGYSLKRAVDAIQEANAFAKERKNGQKCVPTRIPGEDRVAGLYWINPEKLSEDLTPDL